MMSVLFFKYYFRNALWISFYPVVFVLLELVLPLDLTVLPFFVIQQTLMINNYFTPLNKGILHKTSFSYSKAVFLNNLISLLTGVFFFSVFGLILSVCKKVFKGVSDHHVLYQFFPILVWAIALGNLHIYSMYKWASHMSWLSFLYKGLAAFLIFCVFLVVHKPDIAMFSQVLVSGIVATLFSYFLIHRLYD